MKDKKVLIPLGIISVIILVWVVIQSSKPTVIPTTTIPIFTSELTEKNANNWSVNAADQRSTTIQDESDLVKVGEASLRLETESGSDVSLRYQLPESESWDLGTKRYLRFWLYSENPNEAFQNNSPWIRLENPQGDFYQYQVEWDMLNDSQGKWQEYNISLTDDERWERKVSGSVSLTEISSIEIHADTWEYGFTLWVDGLIFE